MIRLSEGLTPHLGGRLWQQYVVDAFTVIERYRLDWIRDHQTTIRSDLYHNTRDAMQKGDRNPSNIGKAIILPASFTRSKHYMTQYFKDSLAICRTLGHPLLFLTMTTNTKWPEIQHMLKYMPNVDVADAPDVVARCGFPIYKRRRTGIIINKKGVNLDNRFVVPFNRDLLVHFQCHMNLEICNNSRSLKYLSKYCLKGHDTATMCSRKTRTSTSATIPKKAPKGPIDEVKHFLDGRYVCASEAFWRIFAFDIHSRWPSVERLPIHLPGENHVSFKAGDVLEDVCDKEI
ncbi:uncharacterized protein LOC141691416 [Apium graveolens]|uniref:uncharacterized protein LOC141691416 n=1 Tax=Apium graveolens TaxID=4045 RepID=UPI003D7ACBDC